MQTNPERSSISLIDGQMTDEEEKENEIQEGAQAEKSQMQTQLNRRKAVESVQKKAKTRIL